MPNSRYAGTRPLEEARARVYRASHRNASFVDTLGLGVSPHRRALRSGFGSLRSGQTFVPRCQPSSPTRTAWAHGVIGVLRPPFGTRRSSPSCSWSLWSAPGSAGFGGTDLDQIAASRLGGDRRPALAYAVSLPVVHLVGRARPFVAMPTGSGAGRETGRVQLPERARRDRRRRRDRPLAEPGPAGGRTGDLVALDHRLRSRLRRHCLPRRRSRPVFCIGALVSLAFYPLAIGSLRDLVHSVARSPLSSWSEADTTPRRCRPGRPPGAGRRKRRRADPVARRGRRTRAGPPYQQLRSASSRRKGTVTDSIEPLDETDGVRILPPGEPEAGPGAEASRG